MRLRRQGDDPAMPSETQDVPAFPSARYFQIHFEQLNQLIHELGEKLDATNRELALLRTKMGIEVEQSKTATEEPIHRRWSRNVDKSRRSRTDARKMRGEINDLPRR
ncbi:hypothetical protein [Methylocaldum sp.]|uniref:hypothetical protein n=1 Tax=Methylocaldum sp. TaxID=1969727 RepID=UPI002D6808A2|nr:hypothetical protein [Methylocaldum sp.]HYE37047.1 hypothetical protein [Methylocaldum sp.]